MKTVPKYAEGTEVPIEKTRMEIETLLKRHGSSGFFSSTDETKGVAVVGFRLAERLFRIEVRKPTLEALPPPARGSYEHSTDKAKRFEKWLDGEERRRWRVQLILIKAKLEMIATGETTVEREFLADMLMPDGSTVGQRAIPALARSYATGEAPSLGLLSAGPRTRTKRRADGSIDAELVDEDENG